MQEFAAAGQEPTYQELAKILKCRGQNFSEWQHKPEWCAAVVAVFRSVAGNLWAKGEASVARRVAKGDAQSFWNYVDRGGPVSWAPAGIGGPDGGGMPSQFGGSASPNMPHVSIHVHGIPERDPLSSAPPPLTLPAAPAKG